MVIRCCLDPRQHLETVLSEFTFSVSDPKGKQTADLDSSRQELVKSGVLIPFDQLGSYRPHPCIRDFGLYI